MGAVAGEGAFETHSSNLFVVLSCLYSVSPPLYPLEREVNRNGVSYEYWLWFEV